HHSRLLLSLNFTQPLLTVYHKGQRRTDLRCSLSSSLATPARQHLSSGEDQGTLPTCRGAPAFSVQAPASHNGSARLAHWPQRDTAARGQSVAQPKVRESPNTLLHYT